MAVAGVRLVGNRVMPFSSLGNCILGLLYGQVAKAFVGRARIGAPQRQAV
jgi:hypothetical protein